MSESSFSPWKGLFSRKKKEEEPEPPRDELVGPAKPAGKAGRVDRVEGQELSGRTAKENPDLGVIPSAEASEPSFEVEGVQHDINLLRQYYQRICKIETNPVATDQFIGKSRDAYPPDWLAREIVQNFVDHNREHPGTLDGVEIKVEAMSDGKTKRFTITGNWPFSDPTGLISPHSEKPTDRETAGGNGIGLKQVAIRYLRDFGVSRFDIEGEGWNVGYRLAQAAAINQDLAKRGFKNLIRHDWLLGDIKPSAKRGRCTYIIETDNAEVIKALEQLPQLGVSERNEFLQNVDYQSAYGAFKWLKPEAGAVKTPRGRLFINGQVMNYEKKGKPGEEYWVGPELVTIRIDNKEYKMTIDRPPLSSYELDSVLYDLVYRMERSDLIEQLKRSEHIWSQRVDSGSCFDREGCFVLISMIVSRLSYANFSAAEYEEHFGGKKYLCWNQGVDDKQVDELRKQGYIICSSYFEGIGMPRASEKLGALEVAKNQVPESFMVGLETKELAEKCGIVVAYEDFSPSKTPEELIDLLASRSAEFLNKAEVINQETGVYRLYFDLELAENLLSEILHRPKTTDQKFLYFIRGVVFQGLKEKLFKQVSTSQGKYLTNFGVDDDNLVVRNVAFPDSSGFFLEVALSEAAAAVWEAKFLNKKIERKKPADEAVKAASGTGIVTSAKSAAGTPAESKVASEAAAGVQVETIVPVNDSNDPRELLKTGIELTGGEVAVSVGDLIGAGISVADLTQAGFKIEDDQAALPADLVKRVSEAPNSSKARLLLLEGVLKAAGGGRKVDVDDELAEKRKIRRRLGEVPVKSTTKPTLEPRPVREEPVVVELSDAEQEQVKSLRKNIPEIEKAVIQLESLVPPKVEPQVYSRGQTPAEKYLDWRESDDFYGQMGDNARYLTGRHLLDILVENNRADIAVARPIVDRDPVEERIGELNHRLKQIIKSTGEAQHNVDRFEIVLKPSEKQLAMLGLLRLYSHITTEVALPNDLFIYDGTGSKGVNIGQKAIGLHEALFGSSFSEALDVFVHEVAHNEVSGHDLDFITALQSLYASLVKRLNEVGAKMIRGEDLSDDEQVIFDIQQQWDRLKQENL